MTALGVPGYCWLAVAVIVVSCSWLLAGLWERLLCIGDDETADEA